MAQLNRVEYWLWGLAEKQDLNEMTWYSALLPPRFWRWLLRHYDRKAGFIKIKRFLEVKNEHRHCWL